ncbi:MAG: AI-2E family transporter [Nanoarchaeota archaeon]
MKDNILIKNSKYLFIGVFLVIMILAFLVVKSYIASLLTSIVLSYLFFPLYKRLNNYIKNKSISALIILLLLIIIIVIPTFFIINSLVKEALPLYSYIRTNELQLNPEISNVLNKIMQYILNEASNIAFTIPKFLIHLFVTMFLFYYFLRDGERFVQEIKKRIPLDEKHKNHVVNEFKNVMYAMVYGLILTGIIEGVIGTLGFYIFKIDSPIFWGIIMMILTILPGVGTSVIWGVAGILKLLQGDTFNGIGILIYGFIFISGTEALLKLKFIEKKSSIHPALIVLGVFGGITLMGFIGLFFGPLILILFITFLKSILKEKL